MEIEFWILLRLVIASVLSGAIGYERERTGKDAGLRTHMLVAVGATLFVSFTDLFVIETQPLAPAGAPGNFRVQIEPLATVEAIVTGISFLGAGTIFVSGKGNRVRGLTTAASIWVTAAVGIAVGLERYVLAVGSALLILVILHVMGRMEIDHKDRDTDAHQDDQGFKHADTAQPK
ncbi:MAG TPA: MgtC/SapB family protein [Roseiflexaceae bacterium]|nr:MgtC/SapB family protein [Roseiflexaceae bacterium]